MKHNTRLVSILLSLALLLCLLPSPVLAADSRTYLALGDSITTGYGLASDSESFPSLVSAELEGFALTNLASDGERTDTLAEKLASAEYQQAVAKADVITLTIGGNDFMDLLYTFLGNELGMQMEAVRDALESGDEDVLALAADVINEKGFVPTDEQYNAIVQSFEAVVEKILTLNPDAVLVVTTQYHPYADLASQISSLMGFLSGDTKELANAVVKLSANIGDILVPWNQAVQSTADLGCYVADVYTAFENSGDSLCNAAVNISAMSVNLDFHPNKAGHQVIAQCILEALPELEPEEPQVFTVSFDLQGHGQAMAAVSVEAGGKVSEPAAPSEVGYLFGGWYRDSACTDAWNFAADAVTSDLTLYAKWTVCDHSGSTAQPDCENDAVCTLCGAAISAMGHDFDGEWVSSDPNGHYKTCARCGEADAVQPHVYDDDLDASCNVCGYNRTLASYTLTFEANGGTAVNAVSATVGAVIDLSDHTTAKEGFTFTGWYLDEGLTQAVSSLTLTENTTVYAGWEAVVVPVVNPFTDVAESDWFYADVMYVYENGLMIGTDADLFSPYTATTRGMIVTILWRLEGSPEASFEEDLRDVSETMYYAPAIEWAAANGILNGYGGGMYGPEDPITREQMAAILWRYAKYQSFDVSAGEDVTLDSYADAAQVSDYAVDAMQWVVAEGILQGFENHLTPADHAKRSEAAAILHRFCLLIQE